MSDILVTSPFQPFTLPTQFKAVFNGYIYCGTVDAVDPSVSQVQVYLVNESGDRVPVAQPLRTNAGGYLVYSGQPAKFVTDSNHSLLVQDSLGAQVWYEPDMSNIDPAAVIDVVLGILGESTGAGLIGTSNGGTVQEELDNAVMYQDPLTKWPDGGTLKIRQGVYNVTTPLVMDYATHPLAFPGAPGVRNHYEGDNMPETIFNCNAGTFAIQMKGDNTYSSQRVHTYDYLGNITLVGTASGDGLLVQGKAYSKLENISLLNFASGEGLRLENTITSEFTNIYAQHNNIGIRIVGVNPTGSDFNAVTLNRITASNNATYGIYGERWGGANVINGLTCEGNGTMGDMNTGGVLINIAGDFAAPAVVFNAPYFELNKGSADLNIVNTSATKPVTVVINGGLFNRASSEYCQTNIAVNSAGGQTKVILIGVVFANSAGYVPSDSRPYWTLGNNCSVIDIGCLFDTPVGKATSPSKEGMVRTGRVAANGTAGVGVGFTVNKIATGVYDVVCSPGAFSASSDGYMAIVQPYGAPGTFCTNVLNLSSSTFRVTISGSNTGVGTDVAFNFIIAKVI